jgi:phosphopantothenoylcysteine decarboxylase/phosphopantothenate--cysteine ligase
MNYKKIIISSGPTREWIDPVRYVSNSSSGKMGFHLAEEIFKHQNNLVYVHGNLLEKYANPKASKVIAVDTTEEMKQAIENELESNTLVIMAAAPADFKPKKEATSKIKKEIDKNTISIELEKNPDILASLNSKRLADKLENVCLVGFAAETDHLEENAKSKLERKGLKFIIGNYVGKANLGFGEVNSTVKVFSDKGMVLEIKDRSKEILAKEIVSFLVMHS